MPTTLAPKILYATRRLCRDLAPLRFGEPVSHVYNPLAYASRPHGAYVRRFAASPKRVVFLGMNPGPFGMAQTGIPFGEIEHVRDWIGIEGRVKKPRNEHPKRPVLGFDCPRSEVSGRRLWGWARETFGTPGRFFRRSSLPGVGRPAHGRKSGIRGERSRPYTDSNEDTDTECGYYRLLSTNNT